jgi:CheY-like chemotaxis protein
LTKKFAGLSFGEVLLLYICQADMMQSQKLILIADDDREDIELLEEAILQADPGVKVHSVTNANKILDFIETADELPCMIILDYNMPEMNGAEILDRLRNDSRLNGVPRIMWSTSNNNAFVKECMQKGASAYLIKPSTQQQLQEQAKQMLEMCK